MKIKYIIIMCYFLFSRLNNAQPILYYSEGIGISPDSASITRIYSYDFNAKSSSIVIDHLCVDSYFIWDKEGYNLALQCLDKETALYIPNLDSLVTISFGMAELKSVVYAKNINKIYVIGSSNEDLDKDILLLYDPTNGLIEEVQLPPNSNSSDPMHNSDAFLSRDKNTLYITNEDTSSTSRIHEIVAYYSTNLNRVTKSLNLSEIGYSYVDSHVISKASKGIGIINSFDMQNANDVHYYRVFDFDNNVGSAFIRVEGYTIPNAVNDGKYLIVAKTGEDKVEYYGENFLSGYFDIYDATSGNYITSFTLPPKGNMYSYDDYPNQLFYFIQDSTQVTSYAVNIDEIVKSSFQIAAMSPSITITKTKDFTLSVNGSGFTPESTIYWDGSPKKTTFVSNTELQADILKKDTDKEGRYSVCVIDEQGNKTDTLYFAIYKKLPKPVIPLLDCIEEIGADKYKAWFGYENMNEGSVLLEHESENKFDPAPQDRGQPKVFLPGRHEKVFGVEFQGKKKLMWKLDKEKLTVTENSKKCN